MRFLRSSCTCKSSLARPRPNISAEGLHFSAFSLITSSDDSDFSSEESEESENESTENDTDDETLHTWREVIGKYIYYKEIKNSSNLKKGEYRDHQHA